MGILEEIHEQLGNIRNLLDEITAPSDIEEPERKPAKKRAAKKKAAAKADKDDLDGPTFLASVKVLAKENKEAVKAARDELFDSSMKLRDVPAEERQNFIDRVEALIEEDDLS